MIFIIIFNCDKSDYLSIYTAFIQQLNHSYIDTVYLSSIVYVRIRLSNWLPAWLLNHWDSYDCSGFIIWSSCINPSDTFFSGTGCGMKWTESELWRTKQPWISPCCSHCICWSHPSFFFFLKYMQLSPAETSALFVLCGQLDAVQIEYSHKHTHLSTPEGLGWPCFLPPCGGLETLLVYNQIFSRH